MWSDCTCLHKRSGKDAFGQEEQEDVCMLNPTPHPVLRQVLREIVDPALEAQALKLKIQHAHLVAACGLICKAKSRRLDEIST